MKDIGIGMLGCGWMGQIHAQNLAALPGVELVASYDHSYELAKDLTSKLGGKACKTPRELYETPEVDAVFLVTRHDVRHELFALSLATSKPTLCEKPLAMTVEEAIWIAKEVNRSGLMFSMGLNQRLKPGIRALAERLKATGMQPTALSLSYAAGGFLNSWAGMPDIGGGILTCLGSHVLDLSRFLIGAEVEAVSCFAERKRFEAPYIEDMAVMNLIFRNGAIASISVNDHACAGYKKVTKQHLSHLEVFDRGRVLALTGANTLVEAFEQDMMEYQFDSGSTFEEANGYALEASLFVEQLKAGSVLLPTVMDGLEAVRLVEAARRSSHEGRQVLMSEIADVSL